MRRGIKPMTSQVKDGLIHLHQKSHTKAQFNKAKIIITPHLIIKDGWISNCGQPRTFQIRA